ILKDTKTYKKEKIEKILATFSVDKDVNKKLKVMFRLIISANENIATIFNLEEEKKLKLTDDYDETEIETLLGEDIEYFNNIKELNSWYTLKDILNNNKYISNAFIEKYNKYEDDLKLLKDVYIKYLPEKFKFMFKSKDEKKITYANYDLKKCSNEDLLKSISADIQDIDFEGKKSMVQDIENNNFLLRLNTKENGAIPFQLHKIELEKILENQSKYYPSINQNKDKIMQIMSFKIPYYVGPLHNDKDQPNNWSVRKEGMEHTKVYPWNFDDVIDKTKSANEFIRRMTNKCTYLPEEDVMPKNSLLYSKYCVLNELNKISCNDKLLSVEEKNAILNEIFKKKKTIKAKTIEDFLLIQNHKKVESISGFQKENEFASNMASYVDFDKILGGINEQNTPMIENIIEWITVFEDRDILEQKIIDVYGKDLTDAQLKAIFKLKYQGWSRLSKKLLTGLKCENEYGKKMSIMDILETTNFNFMQIINDKKFGFDEQIKEAQKNIENKKINANFYEDNVAKIPGSPAIKRGIWQTIKIVDEIVKIMGHDPENIYVEFAREEQDKKRTDSRRKKLEIAY
ncbi:MAG: type II CRISPR RNA-guided endonuclease Cas9, partial [Clostridia bacterium]